MKIRIKHAAIIGTVLLTLFFAASPFLLVLVANTPYVKNKISDHVYQRAGVRIQSSTFSLKILPQPGIKMNHLSIRPDQNTRVSIDALSLNLDLPSLIKGKISLGKIVVNHPVIETELLPETRSEKSRHPALADHLITLKQGFDFLPEEQKTIKLIVKNAASEFFGKLDASIVLFKHENKIQLNSTIHDLRISPLDLAAPDLKKNLDLQIVSVKKVMVDATLDDLKRFSGNCTLDKAKLLAEDNTLLVDSRDVKLSFVVSELSQYIQVEPFQLEYPSATLGVEFLNYPQKRQSHLTFTGKEVQVGQARAMSLKLFKDLDVPKTLFEILLDGKVSDIEVSFESPDIKTLLDEHKLMLSGRITQGKVMIPETSLVVSQITGDADIKDGVLEIAARDGKIKTSKIERGRLSVDLLNHEEVLFDGEFGIDLDLSMLPETLILLLPDTLLAKELAQVSMVKGKTNATLNLAYKEDSTDLYVRVRTTDFAANGQYERIPGDIILKNINVEYQPDLLILSRCSGALNGLDFQNINGSINLEDTVDLDIKKGAGTIDLGKVLPWLNTSPDSKKIISPIQGGSGTVTISSLVLSGPALEPDKWKFHASGKMNTIGLTSREKQQQVDLLSGDFIISDTEKKIDNIQMSVHHLGLLSSIIDPQSLGSIQTPFSILGAVFTATAESTVVKGDVDFSKGPFLKMELAGKTSSDLTLSKASIIDGDMSNASIQINSDADKPVFDFNGSLNTLSLSKLLKPKSHLSNKLNMITDHQGVLIYSDKTDTLNIVIKSLNLNSFLSENKKDSSLVDHRMLTDDLINFKAEKLKVKNLTFTDILAKMSFNKEHTYLRLRNADLCGLTATGYLNIKNGKVYANFPIEAKNKENIQSLLGCLYKKEDLISGPYSLTCNLEASGVNTSKASRKINGTLSVNSRDGRIQKLTLLSRILSVLNVSKVFDGKIPNVTQQGFAYKSLIMDAQIKDSIIHLTHAVIDGHDMTMIFSGTIDPLNDKVDLTCLVAPFKTVDLIIEKIPIINSLLGGTLVSVPVKASGKLSDPDVIPLHPSAVGDGLINMMSTILKAPVEIWEKMAGEK